MSVCGSLEHGARQGDAVGDFSFLNRISRGKPNQPTNQPNKYLSCNNPFTYRIRCKYFEMDTVIHDTYDFNVQGKKNVGFRTGASEM